MDLASFANKLRDKSVEELKEDLRDLRSNRRKLQTPKGMSTKKAAKAKAPKTHDLKADEAELLLEKLKEMGIEI